MPPLPLSVFVLGLLLLHGAAEHDRCGRLDRRPMRVLEPARRVESEAGATELYDGADEHLSCAGVSAARITIHRGGMQLPSFSTSPRLVYILQGRATVGVVIPGCPETYQDTVPVRRREESESDSEEEEQEGGARGYEELVRDEHQRITAVRQGDVVAIPAGAPFWVHNDGDETLQAISVYDVGSNANQLDSAYRQFRLAGGQTTMEARRHQRHEGSESESESERERGGSESSYNILSGFDTELLAESMRVSRETAHKLQGRGDRRGNIVRVRRGGLHLLRPAAAKQEETATRDGTENAAGNGIDEAVCSMKLRENIADPMKADLFTPNAGRIAVLNSQKLPVLRLIKMSANRGVMLPNAILAPHWSINAHAVVYATGGRARLQVVSGEGRRAFDGEVRRGQMVVVPQGYAVMARAGGEGFAWVSFQTSENAMNAPVVGKASALRGMPADVLANAFGVSREEARRIKFGRGQEMAIFSPASGGRGHRRSRPDAARDIVLVAAA